MSFTYCLILFPSSLYIVTRGNIVLYKATQSVRHLPIMQVFRCKIIVCVCMCVFYVRVCMSH